MGSTPSTPRAHSVKGATHSNTYTPNVPSPPTTRDNTATPSTRPQRLGTPTQDVNDIPGSPATASVIENSELCEASPRSSPPRLPALFPVLPVEPSPQAVSDFDVTQARTGRSKWPLFYVVDMAGGFAAVRHLQDSEGMSLEAAFKATFRCPFKKTTWHDNFRMWQAAREVPGEQEQWIAFGKTEEGRWSEFAKV